MEAIRPKQQKALALAEQHSGECYVNRLQMDSRAFAPRPQDNKNPVIWRLAVLRGFALLLSMAERFAVGAVDNVRLSGNGGKEALQTVPARLSLSVVHLIAMTPEI